MKDKTTAPVPPTNPDTSQEPKDAEKPKATKEQLKKLFSEYEKLDAEHQKILTASEQLKAKKSDATKAILDAGGKGPYTYKGDELTVTQRGTVFFFRGKKKDRATIDLD
jgi:hypothetical protein